MNFAQVQTWVIAHPLHPLHIDCATAIMLKILDGKCKMRDGEKRVMTMLYDAIKSFPGQVLESSLHSLIESARHHNDEALKLLIYEKRLLAETAISRPVMKGFKAMIREQGLLEGAEDDDDEAEQ
ncbi:MAG: hypothetical protein Q8K07_00025 [Methylicorpusculum sp.]|uniref:hypothetical protein n=1 Tax=Methylicorpusculum sp. TaxID=2713644 RepID=UPI00272F74C1|nr:hypothetical protein [Methylicorpusculum sp.]MDP2200382.1 hypothetical protein [Methylicorpusculum sp.]